jgi:hypothetical protein
MTTNSSLASAGGHDSRLGRPPADDLVEVAPPPELAVQPVPVQRARLVRAAVDLLDRDRLRVGGGRPALPELDDAVAKCGFGVALVDLEVSTGSTTVPLGMTPIAVDIFVPPSPRIS